MHDYCVLSTCDGDDCFELVSHDTELYEQILFGMVNDFQTTMNKMKQMGSDDNWLKRLFKSISILDFGECEECFALLSQMPMDILFNPDENVSHLHTIEMHLGGECCEHRLGVSQWKKYITQIEQRYLKYQRKLDKHGKKIKGLKCIKYNNHNNSWYSSSGNPRFLHSKHVWLQATYIDLKELLFLTDQCNPQLKMVTFKNGVAFNEISGNSNDDSIHEKARGLNIETIRIFIDLDDFNTGACNSDIFNNQVIIETLNLHNSLKNLTFGITGNYYSLKRESQSVAIANIFSKKYYYNLERVNIILSIDGTSEIKICDVLDWFFELLIENEKILTNQFKQLNIGVCAECNISSGGNFKEIDIYYNFEWNNKIDNKRLDQIKQQCCQIECDNNIQRRLKEKNMMMVNQWLD